MTNSNKIISQVLNVFLQTPKSKTPINFKSEGRLNFSHILIRKITHKDKKMNGEIPKFLKS